MKSQNTMCTFPPPDANAMMSVSQLERESKTAVGGLILPPASLHTVHDPMAKILYARTAEDEG
jgi:hypothetical protein